MKKILFFFCFVLLIIEAKSQVVINEVSPSNSSLLMDEDGDYPDWIELYNAGSSAANIQNYKISDDTAQLAKWVFPTGVTIQPYGFLTIFASGKDRKKYFNHWETIVNAGDNWRYIEPTVEPDSNWRRLATFNDALWNLGPGGIGYADGDDNTVLVPPVNSVYMRRVFNIIDTSQIASAILNIDYDDAFIAYINGIEIARSNIGQNGTPTPFSYPANAEHEAKMYAGGKPDQFYYEGNLLKYVLKNGNNVLAIQLHNVTPSSSDMSSLAWLSLGIKSPSMIYGPVPGWFTLNASSLHTNFKLNQSGETVILSNASGTIIDQLTYPAVLTDDSYGRKPDGTTPLRLFGTPTPNATNNGSTGYTGYASDPIFSIIGGFYTSTQTLVLTTSNSNGIIHYTLDGNIPKASSPVYSTPLTIDSTVVVKARTFHPTLLEGGTFSNTYFIADSTSSNLPIVSLSVAPGLMFDPVTGIYCKGPNADVNIPFFGANFWQEKEIPIHIEFYDKQRQLGFEQDAGLEIYGNYSRSYPQKSMKIVAHDSYGSGSFNYQLFPDKDIYTFKQFILRNAGTDWNQAHMRDALIHSVSLKLTDCDVMAYQPSVVYINGKYWGVYNIREKINKDYLAENHGVNPDSVDLLEYNAYVMSGSNKQFIDVATFIYLNDMADPLMFAKADSMIDLKNFADYYAIETWTNNWDWLTNNVRYWRERGAGNKWRYILWDLDNGMGGLWSYVANSLDTNLNKQWDITSVLFGRLLKNIGYRQYFINRYADLLNTTLTPQNFTSTLYRFRDTLDAEMNRHFNLWGNGFNNPNWGVPGHGSYNDWRNYQLNELASFSTPRQITARNHIQETFELKKQVPVTLKVYPPGAGTINLNTIEIDEMPWGGIYFDSVPIKMTAIPKAGYQFAFWQSGIFYPTPQSNPTLSFNPDTSDVFTAYFYGSPDTAKITVSEINYNPDLNSDAGDWIEIHNYSNWSFDLSKWKFKDSQNSNMFIFSDGTKLPAAEYLVLCEDTIKFKTVYPTVNNFTGPFNFGLSSAGDAVRLFDKDLNLYLSITYSSAAPWPVDANGTSKTLELLNPNSNLNDPVNWFAGCPLGSPGGPFIPCDNSNVETIVPNSDGTVSVYPNPAAEQLHIDFNAQDFNSASFSVELYDYTGKPVYIISSVSQDEVVIQNIFAPGMYFYRISSSKGYLKTGKVIFK